MAGMTREQRKALVAGDEAEAPMDSVDPVTIPAPPKAAETPAAPGVTLTFDQLKELIALASQGNASVGAQMAEALKSSRQPKPENAIDEYHGISHYHPGGKDVPRPELRAEMWYAVWDAAEGKAKTTYPLDGRQMRDDEIEALNAVTAGTYMVTRSDGSKVQCRVIERVNQMGTVDRVLFTFDPQVFDKEHKNSLGQIANAQGTGFVQQMVA